MTNRELFFRYMGLPSSTPLAIEMERAEGIYIYDKSGKEYIDLVSGVAVSNIGHGNQEIVKAIKQQVDKYMHLMVYGEYIQSPQIQLAKKLTEYLPHTLDSIYFVNSGSEANEGAMKLAKRYTGRTEIFAFKNAYHGGTQGALSILGNEKLKYAFRPLLPGIRFLEFNNFEELDKITDKTAAIFIETIQAEAGIILPKKDFLAKLRKKCYETGTLLIIDDIQMGFGRTGKLFSFENFGIIPDILTMAKAMGGGMPIGAFAASKEIMNSLTNNPELGHITTFGGHPVSCAAALANLNFLTRDNLIEDANRKGRIYKDALKENPNIKEIRQAGLMLGVDMEDEEKMNRLMNNFLKNGILTDRFLFRPKAFRIAPPLIISDEEIYLTIELIINSING
jgi:acetylornithine/succinyldiaminopimelate/putrescine aminotransferase